jgi:EthD domain
MIKIVFCLRRLPTLSLDEFFQYWLQNHGPLVLRHAKVLRICRYTQGHSFADARIAPAASARGCQVPPYDGVAEVYWETVEDLLGGASSPEGRAAGRALLEDERRFIDLPNSALFFVREHEIVPG